MKRLRLTSVFLAMSLAVTAACLTPSAQAESCKDDSNWHHLRGSSQEMKVHTYIKNGTNEETFAANIIRNDVVKESDSDLTPGEELDFLAHYSGTKWVVKKVFIQSSQPDALGRRNSRNQMYKNLFDGPLSLKTRYS